MAIDPFKSFLDAQKEQKDDSKPITADQTTPKGIVLGPDGKPCRTCNSLAQLRAFTKKTLPADSKSPSPSTSNLPTDCPPDVDQLGRSSWTLLHSITAQYPLKPSFEDQANARNFISSFSRLYPCWSCAEDFQTWLRKDGNAPRVSSREDFGRWMCEAHNEVNRKLGKRVFDCDRWEERWRTGWKDGRCD